MSRSTRAASAAEAQPRPDARLHAPARPQRLGVLFVTGWYPTESQPAHGVFVRELAHAAARHHDIAVLHCVGPDPTCRSPVAVAEVCDHVLTEGLPTWRVRCRGSQVPGITYPVYLYSILRAVLQIRAAGFSPDLIHAHSYEPGLPAVLLGWLLRIPVVITEHYSGFARGEMSSRELAKARFAMRHAAHVLPVSVALQRTLEQCNVRARYTVVPNTVDLARFAPATNRRRAVHRKRLLYVGRLVPVKGVTTLLRAAQLLARQRLDWQLDIVGDGPERSTCEALAREAGLADRIFFRGTRSKDEIATIMREADAFVLPSLWDNMPCVLIEALAAGLPIVASRTGGIPEIVTEANGTLVPPQDAAALAAAMSEMLDTAHSYDPARLSAAAAQYGHEAVGAVCSRIYQQCVNQ